MINLRGQRSTRLAVECMIDVTNKDEYFAHMYDLLYGALNNVMN